MTRAAPSPGVQEDAPPAAAEPLLLTQPSLAGYVALNGQLVNLPHAYRVAPGQSCVPSGRSEALLDEASGSVLVVPLQEPKGEVIGVLQLVNARDETGEIVPFATELEGLVQALASQAAVAIRNARLEELSFKDPLTGRVQPSLLRAPARGGGAAPHPVRRAAVTGHARPRPLQEHQRRLRTSGW